VFADVDPGTMLLDAAAASRAVTERTVGIMPVHIGGRPCDMDAINALAKQHGLFVLEDAAQATGAEWRGRKTGTIGDLGTFSFQSSKILTAGEGGIITTADDALADLVWSMANVGRIRGGGWYQHEFIAFNLRMTEFQGALLRSQLRRHPAQALRRSASAARLDAGLSAVSGVQIPPADDRVTAHSHALYTFRLPPGTDKQRFLAAVRAEGIPAEAGYVSLNRIPVLLQAAREASGRPGLEFDTCPVSAEIESDVIWLHHNVLLGDERDIDDVEVAVDKVLGAHRG
jgi:dTDP-4-amino-4,6-dideoxygalactose transaminase